MGTPRRRLSLASGAVLAIALACPEMAADPPKLRIETGMHVFTIWRIAADRDERFLVTGGDKTVRVWELATGRLLRTLRPPVAEGREGRIYAIAISPDGRIIAAGGWTGEQGDRAIYLFDRESGLILRRITGLPASLCRLAWSPNGKLLAAGLSSQGIWVYRVADYSLWGTDRDYRSGSYGAAFSPDSQRLVTTCYDGSVRLYDTSEGVRLVRSRKAALAPHAVAFSPDGKQIAVGHMDRPAVDVLAAEDLALQSSLTAPPGNSVSLDAVAWSPDGRYLYAAGRYADLAGQRLLVRWEQRTKAPRAEFPAARGAITDLVALRNGGAAFATTDPGFGVLDQEGRRILWQGPSIVDLWGEGSLRVSADGLRVGFAYEHGGAAPASFSVEDRVLRLGDSGPNLAPPSTTGLDVAHWRMSKVPTLHGVRLKLDRDDISHSLAVAPDQQSFALGAVWNLYLFDRNGKAIWKVPLPAAATSVNIPQNGRFVVAAFADGTIRWLRMEDGKELLAFFPSVDQKRWVLWTPSGHYDASPGGEDLIGWQIDNGPDAAPDFYPASRFRSFRYRPDVVARVLSTHDEAGALRSADASISRTEISQAAASALPPVVRIVSPSNGADFASTEIALRYAVRSASGDPVSALRVLLDGRPLQTARGVVPYRAPEGTITVTVPARDCELAVIAENRNGVSEPASIRLRWHGRAEEFVIRPKLYVLAVGVSAYPEPYTLHTAARDASDFAEMMKRQNGRLYRDVEVRLLTDDKASRDNILDGLEWLQRSTTQHDVAMVFLSGHGDNDAFGTYYFMPVNFDPDRLKRTAIEFSQIRETVQNLAGKVVCFVDTCHAGNVMGGRARGGVVDINAVVNELASAENGAVVFAASTGRQVALERDEWGNGAFTKALLEGLAGRADYQGTGKITVNMLDLYISERVKELTHGQQTPSTTKPQTIPDFPVALR